MTPSRSPLVVGFDLDMTLIDTVPGFAATLTVLGEEYGVSFPIEEMASGLGPPLDHMLADHLPPEQIGRAKIPAGAEPLKPYAIGRFEVTFDDWARCMAGGGCSAQPDDAGWGRNTRPVINVSHDDAVQQYIAWLSSVTGATYRLPTGTEWDFAEEGGGVIPASGVPLIDSQTICQSGNYVSAQASSPQEASCADGFPTTAPAGSFKPNALGLHDMGGNVWEWVSDCWTPGFTFRVKDSERDCRKRLLRGGSWSSRAALSATPPRGFEVATRASKSIGFRVARTLP